MYQCGIHSVTHKVTLQQKSKVVFRVCTILKALENYLFLQSLFRVVRRFRKLKKITEDFEKVLILCSSPCLNELKGLGRSIAVKSLPGPL